MIPTDVSPQLATLRALELLAEFGPDIEGSAMPLMNLSVPPDGVVSPDKLMRSRDLALDSDMMHVKSSHHGPTPNGRPGHVDNRARDFTIALDAARRLGCISEMRPLLAILLAYWHMGPTARARWDACSMGTLAGDGTYLDASCSMLSLEWYVGAVTMHAADRETAFTLGTLNQVKTLCTREGELWLARGAELFAAAEHQQPSRQFSPSSARDAVYLAVSRAESDIQTTLVPRVVSHMKRGSRGKQAA